MKWGEDRSRRCPDAPMALLSALVEADPGDVDAAADICCIGCKVFLLIAHPSTSPASSSVVGP